MSYQPVKSLKYLSLAKLQGLQLQIVSNMDQNMAFRKRAKIGF